MKESIYHIFKPLNRVTMPKNRLIYWLSLIVGSLMFPLMQMLLSLTQKNLVNAIEFDNADYMINVYLFSGLILLLVGVIHPWSMFSMEKSVYTFMRQFRSYAVQQLLSFPLAFFENTHTGDIINRINGDLEKFPSLYNFVLARFFTAIFYGLISIIVMSFLCWQLSLVIIVLAAIETYVMAKISVKIKTSTEIIREENGKANELFFDLLKNLRFIRMSSISNILLGKYRDINRDIVDVSIERNKTILKMNAVSDFFEAFNLIGVLSVGIVMYFNDFIDLGSVFAFLILQDGVTYMTGYLRDTLGRLQQHMVSIRRVFDILDREVERNYVSTDRSIDIVPDGLIICNNLTFTYKDRQEKILDGLSCRIPPGKVTVITGPSGEGKSTLVKLLLGLYRQQTGSIRIGDYDYLNLTLELIRDHFSYVPQSTHLFYDTIENNIRCGNETASIEQIVEAAKLAEAHEFIIEKPDGYQTLVQEHGTNFSGGEKQRIAIARAILKNALVMILDEATSAVDSNTESRIHDYLKKQAENGKTVVIITHRQSALRVSDNIIKIIQ
jgi:ABC-type multidrug transport system fused ATPase/permease subunit